MNTTFRLSLASVTLLLLFCHTTQGSPLSLWESFTRERREANPGNSQSEPSAASEPQLNESSTNNPSRQRREDVGTEKSSEDCPKDLSNTCKSDSCPLDDQTVNKCCKCLQTCCSGETTDASPEAEPTGKSTEGSSTEKSMNKTIEDTKNKIKQGAAKVEGFFKSVGDNIKTGVGTAVDKVKQTASNVKESARKGINQAADWVKNKTSHEESGTSSSPCSSGKDMNCTLEENVSTMDDEMTTDQAVSEAGIGKDSSSSEAPKKSKRSSESKQDGRDEGFETRSNYNSNSNRMSSTEKSENDQTPVPGMRKSKRSPHKSSDEHKDSKENSETTTVSSKKMKRATDDGRDPRDELMKDTTTEQPKSKGSMVTTMKPGNDKKQRNRRDTKAQKVEQNNSSETLNRSRRAAATTAAPVDSTTVKEVVPEDDKSGKVWITVSTSSEPEKPLDSKAKNSSDDEVPIRAPGSINPDEIIMHTTYNSTLSNNNSSFPKGTSNLVGFAYSGNIEGEGISTESSGIGLVEKPGRCRSLKDGLRCVALGKDAAQCKNDGGCSGTKKCCFYACHPNTDVGVCELPIFS